MGQNQARHEHHANDNAKGHNKHAEKHNKHEKHRKHEDKPEEEHEQISDDEPPPGTLPTLSEASEVRLLFIPRDNVAVAQRSEHRAALLCATTERVP